ncbi:signal peptidase I [Bacillus sp. CGMCC 1.16541]|uniref:signal peptidase I n=1 Tax=Bacillus sp. CGMCC 1.16541 TaxID=2185143 RepID=UPI001EF5E1E9|nr:signal peptidase I [Bacillus sp. CGMCC 1.16541]
MKYITTTLLALLAILAISVIFIVFKAQGDIEKVPSVLGYKPLTILSNSMQPAFNAGDVIFIQTEQQPKVGDVVTYKHPDGKLITHRLIEEVNENGQTRFKAKGDNNNVEDELLVEPASILGVQTISIPKAGYAAKFVAGPIGFFLLILVPILIFLIITIFEKLGLIGVKKSTKQVDA